MVVFNGSMQGFLTSFGMTNCMVLFTSSIRNVGKTVLPASSLAGNRLAVPLAGRF